MTPNPSLLGNFGPHETSGLKNVAGVSPELANLDDSLLGWVLKREAC